MKTFFLTLAHAAIGGFASGFLAHMGGAGGFSKISAMAGAGSAITSVLSLFAQSPVQK